MAAQKNQQISFIEEEVRKVKGESYPVRAGRMERALVRKVDRRKLHPNPNDEFCLPEIGPNAELISRYEKDFRTLRDDPDAVRFLDSSAGEPLEVQKIHPDGYMILNGHHRWLAATLAGVTKLPVRIVNLTQEKDIRKMLGSARHDKRITLDLEEIVFSADRDGKTEKPLIFPFNRIYTERLRQGIPALFAYLASGGYDVWLYSSGYESLDYVRELLRCYHTHVTGIVTGTARKGPKDSKAREELEKMLAVKYRRTIHADNDSLLVIDSGKKDFLEIPLPGKASWTAEMIEAMSGVIREDQRQPREKMRVSFDLDEVLFVSPLTHKTEPPLPFPLDRIYRERLRLGTPDVIQTLQLMGYEVWVYTSSFRSEKYIRRLFRHYGVRFDGIVNGSRHLKEVQRDNKTILPQKLPNRYRITLHVDDEEVICSLGPQYGFKTYRLDAQDDEWKEKIINRAEQIRKPMTGSFDG